MRIAFLHFYTFRLPRGIETLIIGLANALAEKGEDVSIITARPTIQPLTAPDRRIKIYAYPTFHYYEHLTIVPFYLSHFLFHKYDLVVAFFADFGEGISVRLANRVRKLPLVLYLCYPYSSAPHRYDSFRRYGWQSKARVILADAAWVAEEAQTFFQLPVSVVPVGTDPVRFSPNAELRAEMRRKLDFTEKDLVLLNVSSLEHRKGVWRVIEAMGRLVHQFPDLKYFILGQGASEQELRKLVADLGLDGRVIFGGTTPHLESYYNMADIFVMLPDAEANSVACHEAMSCALPVVVSNSGGFAESVPPDAGFLVDQDDPAQIDSKLIELISDSQLRLQMGQAGRANVVSHLSWDQIAERFLKVVA